MILNAIAEFSAFFTDIVYTYNSENEFVRGPLGYCTHIVCIFYMILLLLFTVTGYKRIVPLKNVRTKAVRIKITDSRTESTLAFLGIYKGNE